MQTIDMKKNLIIVNPQTDQEWKKALEDRTKELFSTLTSIYEEEKVDNIRKPLVFPR